MIYVSFPGDPNCYPKNATYNPELAHKIFYGLKEIYEEVEWVEFYYPPPKFDPKKDILITQVFGQYGSAPRERVILVENSNFESNKWVSEGIAKYTKHGINKHNNIDGNYAVNECLHGIGSVLFLSNDVAINRWNTDHPDVVVYKRYLQSTIKNIDMAPHPLDKEKYLKYFDPNFMPTPKMLIYHSGDRKNSLQFLQMVEKMGYKDGIHYNATPFVNKNKPEELKFISDTFHMVISCSYSESGPINIIEFMYQGLLVLGHEEWWTGYGYPETTWSYDPNRIKEMKNNIFWLMNYNRLEKTRKIRNDIISFNTSRTDNTWPYFIAKLKVMIDRLT